MRLIDADGLTEGRVENDPVVIATKYVPTAYANAVDTSKCNRCPLMQAAKKSGV